MSDPTKVINAFPGYERKRFKDGTYHNMFRGTDVGRGGYVYSEPGIYTNVALLDVRNMHGESIERLNKFGEYTKRFAEIRRARNAIKTRDFETAAKLLDGKLAKYLTDESNADQLSDALKLICNSAYGIAAAGFDNPLRDPRDVNNTIALRGALFMRTLQDEIIAKGFRGVHYKTDSVKVPNATPEIISFIMDFARKYGYEFEHEATYDRMCLVNESVYIARYDSFGVRNKGGKHANEWTATGAQFQHPFVFKTLFSGEPIEFDDKCETKSVSKAAIYLDLNEGYPDVTEYEEELARRNYNATHPEEPKKLNPAFADLSDDDISQEVGKGHNYNFIGSVGLFYPVRLGCGGGELTRGKDGRYTSVTGTKGYRWLEAETIKSLDISDYYDPSYHQHLIDEAIAAINKYGDFDRFIDTSVPYECAPKVDDENTRDDDPPFDLVPCGDNKYHTCLDCPECKGDVCKKGYSLNSFIERGGEEV